MRRPVFAVGLLHVDVHESRLLALLVPDLTHPSETGPPTIVIEAREQEREAPAHRTPRVQMSLRLGFEAHAVVNTSQVGGIDMLNATREYAWAELLKPFGVTAVKQGLHELAPQYNRAVLTGRSARYKWHTYSNHQRDELYDLGLDAREANNLIGYGGSEQGLDAEARGLGEALEAWKPRWMEAAGEIASRILAGEGGEMSSEVEEKLRALGYLD